MHPSLLIKRFGTLRNSEATNSFFRRFDVALSGPSSRKTTHTRSHRALRLSISKPLMLSHAAWMQEAFARAKTSGGQKIFLKS